MITAGLSKHATQTAISAALNNIIAIACKAQKPISLEYHLDFAKKKAQLSYASPGRPRMLSSFAYTRFAQTVGARAHDAARPYGLSGHRAAAFVLARRGQPFPDRLKPSSRKRFPTSGRETHGSKPTPGGHVRVGLEDNIFYSQGRLATNEELVARVVRIAGEGPPVATPDEARRMLGVPVAGTAKVDPNVSFSHSQ